MAKLQSSGLKVLGDCVLNHRCASRQDARGAWTKFGGRLDWDARAIVRDDSTFRGRGAPRPCSPSCSQSMFLCEAHRQELGSQFCL